MKILPPHAEQKEHDNKRGRLSFALLSWRTVEVDDRNWCDSRGLAGPLPLFSSKLCSPQSPWSHQLTHWAAVQGPGGQMEAKNQLRSQSRTTERATPYSMDWNGVHFLNQLYTHDFLSRLAVTVMPKTDFTSQPERMSSCFPRGLWWGEKAFYCLAADPTQKWNSK